MRFPRRHAGLHLLSDIDRALSDETMPGPSPALRARVLAARRRGVRTILPTDRPVARRRFSHRLVRVAAAAAVLALGGLVLTRTAGEVQGSATAGTLVLSPAMPRTGQRVRVRYVPEAPLAHERWLTLRSRLRAVSGADYNAGVPTATIARLRRTAGGAYAGSFVLPDSIVYAALVVEDSSAGIVDDNAGRDWEVLIAAAPGRPRFASLDQRAHDLMGRNWEEGFATARRMIALYPDDVRAWVWLRFFQDALGRGDDDSVVALHRAKLAGFEARFAHAREPSRTELGYLAWYASYADSAAARRWRTRLLRDAPDNSFAVEWRLMDALTALHHDGDSTMALRRLDTLWRDAPPDRAEQVASYGAGIAYATRDTDAVLRWTDRLLRAARDRGNAARWTAARLTEIPALRSEGMVRIRSQLAALAALPDGARALGETRAEQRARHAILQRGLLASLGQALLAHGDRPAGLDTLALAAASGWDLRVFRAVRVAALATGDTATGFTMAAREAVDPRTQSGVADSLRYLALSRIGARAWTARLDRARAELVRRVLASGRTRSLATGGTVRLLDRRLETHSLRDITDGAVTVVAFWSRFCGPAVQELPKLNAMATRLARDGVRVIGIVEEPSPSPELNEFLYERKVTMPTYLDAWHEASRAFNQWGTPNFYVLDAAGRVRFGVATTADGALLRAEALRLSATTIASR